MSELPPGLEEFGTRLEEAAARDVAERRRQRRGRRLLRNIGLPVGAALVAAAVSAGAVRVADRGGDPIAPETGGRGAALQAAKDPAVVMASATANPSGGPPWVLRAYTNARGRECVQIGRLRNGTFGRVQRGRFRALPASWPGTCAHADDRGALVAVSRLPAQDLTVVYGLAVDRSPVTVRSGRQERRVQPVGLGAFIVVLDGVDRKGTVVVRSKVGGRIDEQHG